MKKLFALLCAFVLVMFLGGCDSDGPTQMKLSTVLDFSAPNPNETYRNYVGRMTESRSCYMKLKRNADEKPSMTSADMPVMDTYYIDQSSTVFSNSTEPGVGPYANNIVMWGTEYGKYAAINDAYYDEANVAIKATYLDSMLQAASNLNKNKDWIALINSFLAANPSDSDKKSVFFIKIRSDMSNDIVVTYDVSDSYDGFYGGDPVADAQLAQNYQHKLNVIRKFLMKYTATIDAQGNSYYPSHIYLKDINNAVVEYPVGLSSDNPMLILKFSGLKHFGGKDINCVWQLPEQE